MKILISILILSMVSCAPFSKNTLKIKGIYILDSKVAFGKLELLENHKFSYRYAIGLLDTKSEGNWEVKDNQIELLSDSTYLVNYIKVKELYNSANSVITIQLKDGSPVAKANVIINNDSSKLYVTDETGKIKLPDNADVSSFTIFDLGQSYPYKVINGKSFIVQLIPNDLGKTYFNKRKFYVQKNKLIDSDDKWKIYKQK